MPGFRFFFKLFILVGNTGSCNNYQDEKAWLIKTNSDGKEEWNKTFDKANYIHASSVQQTSDGGYIFTGYSDFSGVDEYNSWLIKTDPDGNEEWNKTFKKAGHDFIYSVQETRDRGYVLAGHTGPFEGEGNYSAWLIKISGTENPLNEVKELKACIFNLEKVDDSTKTVLNAKLENIIHHLGEGEEEKAICKLEQLTELVNKMNFQCKLNDDQAEKLIEKA
jgi:hypothetical protein